MKVTVLGAGAWGTALALVLSGNGHEVGLWTWQKAHAELMLSHRENREFLPGVALPEQLVIGHELGAMLDERQLIVVVVPSHAVRKTIKQLKPHCPSGADFVCASKGIEEGSLLLMSDVIQSVLAGEGDQPWVGRVGVLSGPSFAKEVVRRVPTNVVAASRDPGFSEIMQDCFATDWLRVYSSQDPVGVEIGGALKNVIAIAAGACDGLGLGQNTRAALITRGVAEMARLVAAKGGDVLTTAGLAGVGDLVLTCTGALSRNRTLGQRLGQGMPLEQALASSEGVAEGYRTAKSAHDLAITLKVDLPICEAVYSVLYGDKEPKEALALLLSRPLRAEWG